MKSWIDYTFWKYQADQWIIEVLSTNTSKTGKSRHVSLLSPSEPPKNFLIYPNQHRKRKQNYLHSPGIFQVAVNSICYFFSHLVSAFNFFSKSLLACKVSSVFWRHRISNFCKTSTMRFNPWRSWVTDHYSPTTQFTIKTGLLFTANLNELIKFIQEKLGLKKLLI